MTRLRADASTKLLIIKISVVIHKNIIRRGQVKVLKSVPNNQYKNQNVKQINSITKLCIVITSFVIKYWTNKYKIKCETNASWNLYFWKIFSRENLNWSHKSQITTFWLEVWPKKFFEYVLLFLRIMPRRVNKNTVKILLTIWKNLVKVLNVYSCARSW